MKKPKSIFYLIYFLFHVALLVVSIYVNYRSEDFEFLLWLREKMSLMVYVSIIGLILFSINMVMATMGNRARVKEVGYMEKEVNIMKAKMFDLQEATQNVTTTTIDTTDSSGTEDEPKIE